MLIYINLRTFHEDHFNSVVSDRKSFIYTQTHLRCHGTDREEEKRERGNLFLDLTNPSC
jgi:hypothetical protein